MRVLGKVGEIHATPDTPNSHPFGSAASGNPRPRFRLVSGLSHGEADPVGDARVELIVELITELTDDRRVRLARRLADIDGNRN